MAERIDVFISSTSSDLAAYRDRVSRVILRLGMFPIDMANFNPTSRNALQLCYDKMQEAEIFIGIYAHRYGYAPGSDVTYTLPDGTPMVGDGKTSITHLEYLWALERKLPMLLFVVDEDIPWPPKYIEDEPGKTRLKDFKALIGKHHVWGKFSTPDNLATQVATGLAELKPKVSPLQSESPKRHDFYKHIQPPPNHVPRKELLAELRLSLLGNENVALTSAIKGATALHGMGGIGKSVMARALCDDPAVQTAYPDGILWVTLGQEPDINTKLRDWIGAFDAKLSEGALTTDRLKAILAELLEDRACLLIVDDVWQKKHGDAFRVGGNKCRLLMTTRDSEVARSLGASVTPIPTMSEAEAIDLLKQWADGNLDGADTLVVKEIVRVLGRLPLAIKLAGAQLKRKTPERWLERFDARKLKSRRVDKDDPHSSLERCFGMSLSELKDTERKLYAALAIFKEDELIREMAIVRLWSGLADLDEDDTQDLLDDLAARALVEVMGDTYPRAAVLHDLLRDFIGAELNDPKMAHQALLNAYIDTQTGDGWHTTPPDGYIYENLAYHLKAVEQASTLRKLLLDYDFLQAKLDATDTNALIADCDELPDDTSIRLIKSALSMGAHVLNEYKDQLPYQLTGRLWTHRDQPDIAQLWRHCHSITPLELIETQAYPPMFQTGGALLRTLAGHTDRVNGVHVLDDGRLLSWSEDATLRLWSSEGEPLAMLEGHTASVSGVHILDGGRFLSWAGDFENKSDFNLRLWSSEGEPLATLEKHKAWVRGVKVLDDSRLLSWSDDSTLQLWSSEGEPLMALEGHTAEVLGIQVLGDGRFLSWSEDTTLRLWSPQGDPLAVLKGHKAKVRDVKILADGRFLSWSSDHTLRLWSSEGESLKVLEGHTDWVSKVLVLANGRFLSWAGGFGRSKDHTLRIWSSQGDPLKVLEGLTDQMNNVLVLADGRFLSWSRSKRSKDPTLRLWSSEGELLALLEGHTAGIRGVHVLSEGGFLSWSWDHILRLWSSEGESLKVLEEHTAEVSDVQMLGDGRFLSWSVDSTMRLWSPEGEPLAVFEGHSAYILGVHLLDDGRLLSWSEDSTLRLWALEGELVTLNIENRVWVSDVRILANDRFLSWTSDYISKDFKLQLWSSEGEPLAALEGHTAEVSDVQMLGDGRFLSWSVDSTLRLWSPEGEPLAVLEGHSAGIRGVHILDDGRLLSWSADSTLRIWSPEGEPLAVLEGHTDWVNNVLVLADGRFLSWTASFDESKDHTLRIWSSEGEPLAVLEGHTDWVSNVLVLADGRFLSWAGGFDRSKDHTLRIWSSEGEPLAVLEGHTDRVNGVKVLADGRFLSWSRDHTLRLWSSKGEPLVLLEGHTGWVISVKVLADGRLLSQESSSIKENPPLRLWSSEGEPLAVLHEWKLNQERLSAWAKEYDFDERVLYTIDTQNADSPFARTDGTSLWVHNVGQFIGDAEFYQLVVHGQTIIVIDSVGRMIFLRVRKTE